MNTRLAIFCSKIIEAGWLFAIISVPLFFNIHTARTFEPDKLTLMRSIVVVMIVAWLIKVLEDGAFQAEDGQSFGQRFRQWLKEPLVLPVLVIVISYIVSTIFALSPLVGWWGSYQRLQGTYTFLSYVVIFALMAATMRQQAQVDRLINAILITSVPVSLYGIIQHNGLDPLPWAGNVTSRVASNMGNAIFVASYLIMIVPITLVRLIKSMTAIVTEEDASWGHTILSAIYIFILAIQMLTILYSQSRGPQLGLLGAFALVGFLILLILRQKSSSRNRIQITEIGSGIGLVFALAVGAAVGGGLGYLAGQGVDALLASLQLQAENLPLLGAALLSLIGFTGVYTYLGASNKGWRWLWISWPILTMGAIVFVLMLNVPNGPLESIRSVPYLSRLGDLTNTQGGTGKVRILIWEGALNLISPHEPLGVEGEFTDNANALRPFIGYGPESMFNAFAYAYPTDLAYHESRGSSADRSHNETMDAIVITGFLGLVAFYFLMGSVFFFALSWLGWVTTRAARFRLIGLIVVGGLLGTFIPYFSAGNFVLSAVGLPFGLFAATFIFLCWQALLTQPDTAQNSAPTQALLLIGILGALVGHFLEVHFVFSIAATYTYFWAYLGLMVAIHKIEQESSSAVPAETQAEESTAEPKEPQNSKRRRRNRRRGERRAAPSSITARGSGWEGWIGSQGLVMAAIFIILIFDFVPVQFDISTGRYSLLWMSTITLLVGLAITFSETAIKKGEWRKPINWGWGLIIYLIATFAYSGLYFVFHAAQRQSVIRLATATNERLQALNNLTEAFARQQGMREAIQTAVDSANSVFNLLIGFYGGIFVLFLIMAFVLSQGSPKRLSFWRQANWWLYPPLIIAALLFVTFKNINVVEADTLLKEGQKYRDARLYDLGIAVHQAAVDADPDEDFYYLMLALNYQLKAQDQRVSPEERQQAWLKGEEIALEARNINKYNPDNTGNMGRYYFTIAQIFDPAYFDKAIDFFKKATQLAPQNIDYYNLVGQAYYATGNYDNALEWYNESVKVDPRYDPSWLYKGDTHVAKQEMDEALEAHSEAIHLNAPAFARDNFDTRLNFYISVDRANEIIDAFQTYLDEHARADIGQNRGFITWAIGHIYRRINNLDEATKHFESAISLGYDDQQVYISLGEIYIQQENYPLAEQAYTNALSKNPNLPQAYSSLGFIYARTGRLEEAIAANQKVLEAIPTDYDSNKNLALLNQQIGNLEEALAHAQTALEVAPEANKDELRAFITQVQNQLQPVQTNP